MMQSEGNVTVIGTVFVNTIEHDIAANWNVRQCGRSNSRVCNKALEGREVVFSEYRNVECHWVCWYKLDIEETTKLWYGLCDSSEHH